MQFSLSKELLSELREWIADGKDTAIAQATLDAHGAVSEAVARELAEGVRGRLGADWAASITGVAGPSGGSEAKPVGTVFIGVAGPGFVGVRRFHYPGERASIRDRAARGALALTRLAIGSPADFAVPFIWEWKPRG